MTQERKERNKWNMKNKKNLLKINQNGLEQQCAVVFILHNTTKTYGVVVYCLLLCSGPGTRRLTEYALFASARSPGQPYASISGMMQRTNKASPFPHKT